MSPPIIVDEYRHQKSTLSSSSTPTTPTTNRKVLVSKGSSSSSSSFPLVENYDKRSRSSSPPSPTLSSSSSTTTSEPPPTLCNIGLRQDSRSQMSSKNAAKYSLDSKLLPRLPQQQQERRHDKEKVVVSTSEVHQQDESITSTSVSTGSIVQQVLVGCIASVIVIKFSLTFPFVVSPYEMAKDAYVIAYWNYDPTISHFDNTIWTYGTDYLLAIIMFITAFTIRTTSRTTKNIDTSSNTKVLTLNSNKQQYNNLTIAIWLSRGLLGTYMFSVIAGGISHQYFLTTTSQNTILFRILWTICVGFVSIASIMMGCSTSYYLRIYNATNTNANNNAASSTNTSSAVSKSNNNNIYIISEYFWIPFSLLITIVVAFGYFSFQCQASDIFIAGITQFPSTFYIVYVLLVGLPNTSTSANGSTTTSTTFYLSNNVRIIGSIGFLLNAPLLPMYPILVKYFTLPVVNTFLHTWLCIAWSIQGYCMKHIIHSLEQSIYNSNNHSMSMSIQQKQRIQQQQQQQQQQQSYEHRTKLE